MQRLSASLLAFVFLGLLQIGCGSDMMAADESPAGTLTIDQDLRAIQIGDEVTLTAMFSSGFSSEVTWTSLNSSVATVDQNGTVRGVSMGSTAITATSSGITSMPVTFSVLGTDVMGDWHVPMGSAKTVTGGVTVQETAESQLEVTFSSDFTLTDGPNLFVFLANADYPDEGSLNLGAFKSASGSQTYQVPTGISVTDFNHVVIYCIPASIVFAYARTW